MDRYEENNGLWEARIRRTPRWVRIGLLVGILGAMRSALVWAQGNAPGPAPVAQSGATSAAGKSAPAPDAQATPVAGKEPGTAAGQAPSWHVYIERLRQVTQEQARVRGQQDMLRYRVSQPGGPPERVRERVAARLHELDAEERDIRQKKREILQEIAGQGDKLRQQLEDAQADLLTREAAESDPEKRRQIGDESREVEGLLRHLSEIQENPDRYVDFNPRGREGPGRPDRGPESGPIPPEAAARRIQQMEEQVHFLRRRIDSLERQLEEMKQFLGNEGMPAPKEPGALPGEGPFGGEKQPGPPPEDRFDRWRGPERPPLVRPRRGPIPPAGYAPGSEPGLEPREGAPGVLPGRPEPLGPELPSKPEGPVPPPDAPQQGPSPESVPK